MDPRPLAPLPRSPPSSRSQRFPACLVAGFGQSLAVGGAGALVTQRGGRPMGPLPVEGGKGWRGPSSGRGALTGRAGHSGHCPSARRSPGEVSCRAGVRTSSTPGSSPSQLQPPRPRGQGHPRAPELWDDSGPAPGQLEMQLQPTAPPPIVRGWRCQERPCRGELTSCMDRGRWTAAQSGGRMWLNSPSALPTGPHPLPAAACVGL